jgi:two-component system response regulator MprA
VLVAEDDRAIRESLRRMLSLDGFDVAVASDGLQALSAARTTAYDLLILDVLMPGLDGLEVCRALRREGNSTPVLVLTAGPETWPPAVSRGAGAETHLAKSDRQ